MLGVEGSHCPTVHRTGVGWELIRRSRGVRYRVSVFFFQVKHVSLFPFLGLTELQSQIICFPPGGVSTLNDESLC